MIKRFNISVGLVFLLLILTISVYPSKPVPNYDSAALQNIVDKAVASTLSKFATDGLKADELAVTVYDLTNQGQHSSGSYRGESRIYAASVVKMFYLSYYFRLVEDGKLKPTSEAERALRDMIVDSSNEATGLILDILTGTTSGPELPAKQFANWSYKRDVVNRYFKALGYTNINVNQKTHCEDAYGIEQQYRNYKGENRNMLTSNAAARLMKEIALGESINNARSAQMMGLMKRDWEKPAADNAHIEFISYALAPGTKLWSKEGWTSKTRHDAAYIETPEGLKLVISVFTENHFGVTDIIPNVARDVIKGLGGKTS